LGFILIQGGNGMIIAIEGTKKISLRNYRFKSSTTGQAFTVPAETVFSGTYILFNDRAYDVAILQHYYQTFFDCPRVENEIDLYSNLVNLGMSKTRARLVYIRARVFIGIRNLLTTNRK